MRSFQYGIKTGVNLKLASNCLTSENKKPYLVCSLQETFAGGAVFWEKTARRVVGAMFVVCPR